MILSYLLRTIPNTTHILSVVSSLDLSAVSFVSCAIQVYIVHCLQPALTIQDGDSSGCYQGQQINTLYLQAWFADYFGLYHSVHIILSSLHEGKTNRYGGSYEYSKCFRHR